MKYFSTRDKKLDYDFKSIFVRGLSPDGGLFVPKNIVKFSNEDLHNLSKLNHYSDRTCLCLSLQF